jgi:hypothetical protein
MVALKSLCPGSAGRVRISLVDWGGWGNGWVLGLPMWGSVDFLCYTFDGFNLLLIFGGIFFADWNRKVLVCLRQIKQG